MHPLSETALRVRAAALATCAPYLPKIEPVLKGVWYHDGEGERSFRLGMDVVAGEPVCWIFETSDDRYLVCTSSQGVYEGNPLVLERSQISRVELSRNQTPLKS